MEIRNLNKKLIISFSLKILGAVGSYVVTLIIARKANIQDASNFFYLFSLYSFFLQAGRYGVDIILLKKNDIESIGITKTGLIRKVTEINFTLFLLASAVLLFLKFNGKILSEDFYNTSIILFASILGILYSLFSTKLQANHQTTRAIAILNIIPNYGFAILLLISPFKDSSSLVTQFFIIAAINCGYAYYVTKNKTKTIERSEGFNNLGHYIPFIIEQGLPNWINVLARQLTIYFPLFLSPLFLMDVEIASLNSAFRVTLMIGIILISINYVIAPIFSDKFNNGDYHALARIYGHILKLLFICSFLGLITLYFTSDFIMSLFGNEYASYGSVLFILGCGQLVSMITGPSGILLVMIGEQIKVRDFALKGLLVSSAITCVFAYNFRLDGIAYSILIAYIILNLPTYLYCRAKINDLRKK